MEKNNGDSIFFHVFVQKGKIINKLKKNAQGYPSGTQQILKEHIPNFHITPKTRL